MNLSMFQILQSHMRVRYKRQCHLISFGSQSLENAESKRIKEYKRPAMATWWPPDGHLSSRPMLGYWKMRTLPANNLPKA
jgi:hypothetical protein